MISSGPLFLALALGLLHRRRHCRDGLARGALRHCSLTQAAGCSRRTQRLTKVANSASGLMVRAVGDKAPFGRRNALEQAGIKMRQADFNLLVLCVSVTAGLVGFVLGGVLVGILFPCWPCSESRSS